MANIILDADKGKGVSSTFTLNQGDLVSLRGFDFEQAQKIFVNELGQLVTVLQDGSQFLLNNFAQLLAVNPDMDFLKTEAGTLTYGDVIAKFLNSTEEIEPALGPTETTFATSSGSSATIGEGSNAAENFDLGGPGLNFGDVVLSQNPADREDDVVEDNVFSAASTDVTPLNNIGPNVNSGATTTPEDTSVALNIPAPTDIDSDDASLTISVATLPDASEGVIQLNGTDLVVGQALTPAELSSLVFVPTANYNGTTNFVYFVSDGISSTASEQTITVTGVADDPTFTGPSSLTMDEDTGPVALNLDIPTDPDTPYGDVLSVEITTPLSSIDGTITLDGNPITDGQTFTTDELSRLQFNPNQDYNGVINLNYQVTDSSNTTVTNSHTITVNPIDDAPVANDSTSSQDEDTTNVTLNIPAPTDPDSAALTATVNTLPTDGVLRFANGTLVTAGVSFDATELPGLTFTPDADYNGTVTVDYTVSDGALDTDATHTITVNPVNDAPVTGGNTASSQNEDESGAVNIPAPTDVDGDTLTAVVTNYDTSKGELQFADGSAVVIGDNFDPALLPTLVFVPAPNEFGTVVIDYNVTDGTDTTPGQHTITIVGINDDPVANDSASTMLEDAGATDLNIPAPTDVDGDNLSINLDSLPTDGTLTYANGTLVSLSDILTPADLAGLRFTPNANFNGTVEIDYTVSDGTVDIDATHTITVTAVNDDPVADDSTSSQAQDSMNIALNIPTPTDVDGDTVSVTIDTLPTDGVLKTALGIQVNAGDVLTAAELSGLTFTPDNGFTGTVSLDYTVNDGNGGSDTARHTIDVNNVNDAPVANNSVSSQDEDSSNVSLNIPAPIDADGDPLTITVDSLPNGGVLKLANGTVVTTGATLTVIELQGLTFTPNADYNGTSTLVYTVSDPLGLTDSASHVITVNSVNDAPVANDSSSNQSEDSVDVPVNAATPTDVDGDTLTITIDSIPASGVLKLADGTVITNGATLTVAQFDGLTFTPATNFTGSVDFDYTVTDPSGEDASATHTINVNGTNDDPVANNSASTQAEDSSTVALNIPVPTDTDGDTLSITIDAIPANGVLRLGAGTVVNSGDVLTTAQLQLLTFTPDADYNGTVTLNYTVTDGNGGSDSAAHTITVTPVNDNPVAGNTTSTQDENTTDVALNIPTPTDVDGDTLTVTINTLPTGGTLKLANGTTVSVNDTLTTAEFAGLTFTPNANYNGSTSFNYTVTDGAGGLDTATHTINVSDVNDAPVANDTTSTQAEDSSTIALNIPAPTDTDGDTLTITVDSIPANGVLRIGTGTVISNGDTLTVAQLQALTFTPNANYNGTVDLNYTVTDPSGESDTATHTITVTPVNDDPVANDSSSTQTEDSSATALNIAAPTDVDGDTLSITINSVPANGVLRIGTGTVVNNGDVLTSAQLQALTFTPNPNFSGVVDLDYTVTDGNGGVDTATHTINVTDTNDIPDVSNSASTQTEDSNRVNLGIDAPTDSDGDALIIRVTDLPDNGTLRYANGTLVYKNAVISESQLEGLTFTPNANFNGKDTFTYTVSDGTVTQQATHTITVSPVTDALIVSPGDLIDNTNIVSVEGLLRAAEIEDCVATGTYSIDKAFPTNTVLAGASYSYQIAPSVFTDPDGGNITYAATYTYNGQTYTIPTSGGALNINPTTGLITGKIPASYDGDFSVTIIANSSTGASASKTIDYNLMSQADFNAIEVIGPRYGAYLLAQDIGDNLMVGVGDDDILRYDFLKTGKGIIADLNEATVDKQNGYVDSVDGYKEIVGTQYDDIIIAKDGVQTNVNAYKGNDLIYSSSGGDIIVGGDGFDTVSYERSTGAVNVDLLNQNTNWGFAQNDTLVGIEALEGSKYNDVLKGDNANNTLTGGEGSDKLYGNGGNDTFIIDENDSIVDGGSGYDRVMITDDNSYNGNHISFAGAYTVGASVDVSGIEEINMDNKSYNETLHITVKDLIGSSEDNILRIKGDLVSDFDGAYTDDNVQIHDKTAAEINNADRGTTTYQGVRYDVYDFGSEGKLYVEYGLDVLDASGNQV